MSANTDYARALANISSDYANNAARIHLQQGDIAARDIAQRGQIWSGAIQQIGQIAAQSVQAGQQAHQEDQIKAILQKYPDDISKAIPEINKINPELGHKIAKQTFEEKKWAHDLQTMQWETDLRKLQAIRAKLNATGDQEGWAGLRYGVQQLGVDVSKYSPVYDHGTKAQLLKNLDAMIAEHQGTSPKPPEMMQVDPTHDVINKATGEIIRKGVAKPVAPKLPEYGTDAYRVMQEENALRAERGLPLLGEESTPPSAAPPPTGPLTLDQVERRAAQPAAPAAARPVAPTPAPAAALPDAGYGNRYGTTTPKGEGFLGPLQRPDGKVMSEFSIGVTFNGKDVEIPTLVPTLTKAEVQQILTMKEGDPLPSTIANKAVAHAKQRMAAGKDPFAGPGEQQMLYPEFAAQTPSAGAPGAPGAPEGAGPAGAAPSMTPAQVTLEAYKRRDAAKAKETADKPPAVGSFEDYLARYASAKGKPVASLTTADIETARKRFNQADDKGLDPALAQLRQLQIDAAVAKAKAGGDYSPDQIARFNSIVAQYDRSPLVRAADRTIVLKDAVKQVREDPKNAASQLNLAYGFIQAMDTYQSAVREGELQNLGVIGTRLQALALEANRVASSGAFLPPGVVMEIATSADQLIKTIDAGRTQKERQFKSQAEVSGVGPMWDRFTAGFKTPPADTAGAPGANPFRKPK